MRTVLILALIRVEVDDDVEVCRAVSQREGEVLVVLAVLLLLLLGQDG